MLCKPKSKRIKKLFRVVFFCFKNILYL
uniref:Uncharacterized protein n=1 Tax=Medicago truncatula TaxID=3880 RepID=I3SD47_MEDTR|nr:unknown [Medicago truncatula]